MYIRTKTGKIANVGEIVRNSKNEIIVIENLNGNNLIAPIVIKSQGDNLIDVLEVGDIVTRKEVEIDNYINFSVNILENKFNMQEDKIVSVITHEHYMPLKQEVK